MIERAFAAVPAQMFVRACAVGCYPEILAPAEGLGYLTIPTPNAAQGQSLYYRVVVIRAPLQGLCYTVRDAVDWCHSPITQMIPERFQPQPFAVLLIS